MVRDTVRPTKSADIRRRPLLIKVYDESDQRGVRPPSQIGGADPEHFAVGFFGVEPEQRQLRKGGLQRLAAAADLAQQPTLRGQMPGGLLEDAADDGEPVGAAVKRKLRLG